MKCLFKHFLTLNIQYREQNHSVFMFPGNHMYFDEPTMLHSTSSKRQIWYWWNTSILVTWAQSIKARWA